MGGFDDGFVGKFSGPSGFAIEQVSRCAALKIIVWTCGLIPVSLCHLFLNCNHMFGSFF